LGKIFVFFGQLFISAAATIIGYVIISYDDTYKDNIFSPAIPTVMFFIISFVIGSIFMSIFGMAADTLLMCLCVDKELSQGSAKSCPTAL